jgi:hypothetical protein
MSTQTTNLQMTKPDRNEYYDINIQNENLDKIDAFCGRTDNPHKVTKSQVGLDKVPNVSTNEQTPTYTEASSNTSLASGEKLSIAFGKISKAINSLITHLADNVGHITTTERNKWNAKLDASATAVNAEKLDGLDSTAFVLASVLKATGVIDNYLTNLSIGDNFTIQTLCNNDKVTFFTNWADNTNFPKIYGSGVMIPCADISNRLILYGDITDNTKGFYVGNAKLVNGVWSVTWYNPNSGGNADTLDGYHADNFFIRGSNNAFNYVPTFSGGVGNTEGGEIHFAKPPVSDIVQGDITVDIVDRYFRIFCTTADGTRIAKIDFSSLTGDNNLLHTGVSAPVKIQDTAPEDTTALWVS